MDVHILGLSPDTADSHQRFCAKHALDLELLADPEAVLLTSLGVGQTVSNGTRYWDRCTFIADEKAIVRKAYRDVNPVGHAETVLADIRLLRGGEASGG
jgi:peroxiredoxin Q/BCP